MKKILIIDDETDICQLLKRFLTKKGFEAESATEVEKGLELVKTFQPDLVLCDFRLGKVDGSQVLSQIKAQRPQLPVIIMTGYSDIKVAVNVMKLGAFDYLTKPLFPDEIFLTIQRALAAVEAENAPTDAPENVSPAAEKPTAPRAPKRKNQGSESGYIFGDSPVSEHLVKQIGLVAPTNYSVIIYGESGSGKEAVAQEIHRKSSRAGKPFVAMDCGAISPQLAGSELFGHEKGSFTGAMEQKIGHFELANGGTIFLDEVSNLPYEVQVALLRVVQERRLRRIGGTKEIEIDVRIIVASNEKLLEASRGGKFREDLYHRFNEFSLDVPPLRDRGADILMFARHFLEQTNAELGKNVVGFAPDVERLFQTYSWFGNLRELKNVMKRATLLCDTAQIQTHHLPFEMVNFERLLFSERENRMENLEPPSAVSVAAPAVFAPSLPAAAPVSVATNLKSAAKEAECDMILQALKKSNFNKSKTAELLGIDRKTLYNKMKMYNL